MRLWHLCVCVRPSVRFGLQGFRGLGFVVPFRDLFGRVARVSVYMSLRVTFMNLLSWNGLFFHTVDDINPA